MLLLVCAGLIVVVLFIWPGLVIAARNALHRRWRQRTLLDAVQP